MSIATPPENMTYEELRQGYRVDKESGNYTCICCGKTFEAGEVFPFGGRFFEAFRAVLLHLDGEHPDRFERLLRQENKYNPLTENQKELFGLFRQGLSDAEIADRLEVSLPLPCGIRSTSFANGRSGPAFIWRFMKWRSAGDPRRKRAPFRPRPSGSSTSASTSRTRSGRKSSRPCSKAWSL